LKKKANLTLTKLSVHVTLTSSANLGDKVKGQGHCGSAVAAAAGGWYQWYTQQWWYVYRQEAYRIAVANKADRTAYDVRYSCRTDSLQMQRLVTWPRCPWHYPPPASLKLRP